MAATPFLSVVITTYNDIHRLPTTVATISASLVQQSFPAVIIVVDDSSTDGTAGLAASYAGVYMLRCKHRSKGVAVRVGALPVRSEDVLLCDADLATPIEEWEQQGPHFSAGFDVVIRSREGIGAQRYNEPFHRYLMGRIFKTC
ncbi:glycosyltransferase [uncultured Chloroflexus sp.]|uniref:glycosyltransferase n=1 Tax=uncultured Chloroflexus sp. TaxID=214040 RepID=UPI002611D40E|nr:glycosyltransferase [uncultured Chloroflexus sp.]